MKKEQHAVTNGFLYSTTNLHLCYNLDCCITETELYYKLTLNYGKEKKAKTFGTINDALDFINELTKSYTIGFKTWELLNFRLS